MSDKKVRVTTLFGAEAAVGLMDPKVSMATQQGTILEIKDSGRFLVSVSGTGVGQPKDYYAHQLRVLLSHASGVWSYPSGDGAIPFGHHATWPNGDLPVQGSGIVESGPGLPNVFSRP